MDTNANIGAFCEESVREILLSLPVRSLLRFKCVCKNWGTLINNPSFTIEHLNFSKKKHLIYDYGAAEDAPSVTLVSDNGIDEQNSQRFGDNNTYTNLLGSIDGLFFLERQIDNGIDKGILCALWNPANREVRHLPAATIGFEPFDLCDRHFGFGLDPMTKDYKVVYYNHKKEYAALYSCSRDSWKIFKHDLDENQNTYCERSLFDSTNYLNGSYYWLLTENPKCRKILSFDFVNEMFVEMEGPPDGHGIYSWTANLISLGDSIAILNYVDRFVTDVWVMIQPGVWNKLVTFHCFLPIKTCYGNFMILVTKSSRLVTYNVRTNKTRLLEFRHPRLRTPPNGDDGGCGVYYYKESLVTIKQHGPNGELDLRRCLTKLVDEY